MLFEAITSVVSKKAVETALTPISSALQSLLQDRKAFKHAREVLRSKYEVVVRPASYDWVLDNLILEKSDYIEYFAKTHDPTSESLTDHLKSKLLSRSEGWRENRPCESVFSGLVDDFLKAYQLYFVSHDPQLTSLTILAQTGEVLSLANEIRASIRIMAVEKSRDSVDSLKEVKALLSVVKIPFEVVEDHPNHIDLIVTDTSGIFPAKLFVSVNYGAISLEELDAIAQRARRAEQITRIILVFQNKQPSELRDYAERRAISVFEMAEFRESLLRISPNKRFTVGRAAVKNLVQSLNVDQIYVEPDGFLATPGDHLQWSSLENRQPAKGIVEDFLLAGDLQVLFLVGGYGAGKSVFAARLAQQYTDHDSWIAVHLQLRHINDPFDIVSIVQMAKQVADTVGGIHKKCLVILDGLDEAPGALDVDKKRENLLSIVKSSRLVDKLVISVRMTYLIGMEDFWQLFLRQNFEHPMWTQLANLIPEDKIRPSVSALVLREFSSDQIHEFAVLFGKSHNKDPEFATKFFEKIIKGDGRDSYRSLAKNPLYLYLLATAEPWNRTDIKTISDVYDIFVNYWLERDIEKGRSRWKFSATDRETFAGSVAWYMYEKGKDDIGYREFFKFVKKYFHNRFSEKDLASVALDLQTTGLFAVEGGGFRFIANGFCDNFVAKRLFVLSENQLEESFDKLPYPAPNTNQCELMLAMAEVQHKDIRLDARRLFGSSETEMAMHFFAPISIPSTELIYIAGDISDEDWKFVNGRTSENDSDECDSKKGAANVRFLYNCSIEATRTAGIPVVVANRLGMHARASAKYTKLIQAWCSSVGEGGKVLLSRRGRRANSASIMSVMKMATGVGGTVYIGSEDYSSEQIQELLEFLRFRKANDGSGRWVGDFEFQDFRNCPFHPDCMPEQRAWIWN